jgi:exodeoxyribonuclease I
MNFAFYDLETTGTSPAFDQPLQFAAILTDGEFREIERVNLRCRIAPHIIPSPWALAVTGVRPAQLVDPAFPTLFEFTQEIGALIERWSPAIWTGFNSIRFDEEMLRQAFYQNLQPDIFATQFNRNTRFDVLTALYAVRHRQPDLFQWPVDPDGRVRFKLDRIAPLNGFAAHNAHDALGDVEATIHIARQIAQRAPELWSELLANRDKGHVQATLATFQPHVLVERFGGGMPRATVGCFCGTSASNPNQAAFFDLDAADPACLLEADEAVVFAAVDATPKVIRAFSINTSPALLSVLAPSAEQLRRAEMIAQGLYLMDEPESALSPARQLDLVEMLARVQETASAQIIMATHSPILMGIPGARLLQVTRFGLEAVSLEETRHFRLYRAFCLDPHGFIAEELQQRRHDAVD